MRVESQREDRTSSFRLTGRAVPWDAETRTETMIDLAQALEHARPELGEICTKNLLRDFPELEPLTEEWKKTGE